MCRVGNTDFGCINCFVFFTKKHSILVIDLKSRPGKLWREKIGSSQPKADCTLTLSDEDMISMVSNFKS